MNFDLGFGALGALFWIALIVASDWDLSSRRVPNELNLGIAISGVIVQFATHGFSGLATGLLGALTAFLVVLLPFVLRLYKGGDAKLVMALGCWLGPEPAAWMFLYGVALGGLLALIYMLVVRVSKNRNHDSNRAPQMRMVPMALAFSLGAAVAALWPKGAFA